MADKRSHVEKSRFKEVIEECLQSRWAPARVYRHLCLTYGEGYPHGLSDDQMLAQYDIPSVKSIQRYAARYLPTVDVVPESLIEKKLKGIPNHVDTVRALEKVIPFLENRLGRAFEMEENMPLPLGVVDTTATTYLDAVERLAKHKFDLGLLKKVPTTLKVEGKLRTWRDDVIDLLKQEKVTPAQVEEEMGEDLARELFVAAGIRRDEGGQAKGEGATSGERGAGLSDVDAAVSAGAGTRTQV